MRQTNLLVLIGLSLTLSACDNAEKRDVAPTPNTQSAVEKASPSSVNGNEAVYKCEEMDVKATFIGENAATIVVGGQTLAMKDERAASGAKYSDGQGNSFWTEGDDEAILTLKGQKDRNCTSK